MSKKKKIKLVARGNKKRKSVLRSLLGPKKAIPLSSWIFKSHLLHEVLRMHTSILEKACYCELQK